MGMYSYYTLDIQLSPEDREEDLTEEIIIEALREENENAEYCLSSDGGASQEGKWYDAERDLENFSKKFPRCVFDLYKEYEELEETCHIYVKNGNSEVAYIKPVFDPNPFSPG